MNARMYRILAGAVLLLPLVAYGQKNGCIECHGRMDEELKAPVAAFAADVHAEYGLGCRDCHGGNPAEDDIERAKDKTFKGAPGRDRIPALCGGCHADAAYMRTYNPALRTDQLSQYETSRHGQLIKSGDAKAAVCTDCHGTHGILAAKFPKSAAFPWNISKTCGRCHADKAYMEPYRIATDQVEEYGTSVHAHALFEKKDLSAPTCNDCHGNHGAYPPEVSSVARVCRQCHPSTGELFIRSPHKDAFDAMEIGECEACHGNHVIVRPTTAMIGTSDEAVCMNCHEPGSAGHAAADEIRRLIDGFAEGYHSAEDLLARAASKGVEVSDAEFGLRDVNTILLTAKNLTHSLDAEEIGKTVAEGEAALAAVRESGDMALKEARFRRRGLAVTTVILALFAVALALKVRARARDRAEAKKP